MNGSTPKLMNLPDVFRRFRTLLLLGRVSNLPTIWTNCLAGWWLGGGENMRGLASVLVGGTFLYIGGMFLNDACDVSFDRQFRRERPIPAGLVSAKTVWILGITLLVVGALPLLIRDFATAVLTMMLLLFIVAYDALHKYFVLAPVLMGGCRFLVYLVAASTAADGVNGWALWCGIALGIYVIGLSCIARVESTRDIVNAWPLLFLFAPVILGIVMNAGLFRPAALVLSGLLAAWIIWCAWPMVLRSRQNVGNTVSNLLAGIAIVDLLAVLDFPLQYIWIFPACFLLSKLLQRIVPAT